MEIAFQNLKKTFGEKTAIDIQELKIGRNTLLGLVGNNGAGKTTLFRLALDLTKADTGACVMSFTRSDGISFSTDVKVDEEWKSYTGAYIDESFLIDYLTPEEYFQFIAKANSLNDCELKERIKVFEEFMNEEILGQKKLIRNLSAGNKQKVGIISAMINHPQLLILDEPFNFLDPTSQNSLKKILTDYHNETGAIIMVSSHNLNHTIDISNRILVMECGKIVKDITNCDKSGRSEVEEYFNS